MDKKLVISEQMNKLKTPCFLVDESRVLHNLNILQSVKQKTGCKILLAQKAFSMFSMYPLISEYLDGTTSSGLYEARLAYDEFPGEVHVYKPAFREDEIHEVLEYADDIVFNSPKQLEKYIENVKKVNKIREKQIVEESGHVDSLLYKSEKLIFEEYKRTYYKKPISIGLRINPEVSTQEGAIYDPCSPNSRLGTTSKQFENMPAELRNSLDGLHFHTLCEQNSDALETTVQVFEKKFGKYLHGLKWINLGGGHHITREDYDIDKLVRIVTHLKHTYDVQVYLEPGEAVVLNAGFLLTRVMDIVSNQMEIAILDTSAACHMPDVIEMPYRPPLQDSGEVDEKENTYRLAGPTCLAGDIIGDYSFDLPLKEGDMLVFLDMALYTMVKTNTFNGMPLPDIAILRRDGEVEMIKQFTYENFRGRLS